MTLPNRPVPPIGNPPVGPPIGRPVPPNPRPSPIHGLSLATHFTVNIGDVTLSCARIETVELAADASQLEQREDPNALDGVLWQAPRLPGRLTIARALDGNRTLYEWRREAQDGKPAVRSIEIRHLDRTGSETLYNWSVRHAWPIRWSGPRYDALHGGIAFEQLEIVYHDLVWI